MIREIVRIDEAKCDGCGLCVPACHEGAIRIIDGKARLVSDRLCDGLGACLGHCPRGAITIERREADGFDEAAVQAAAAHETRFGTGACPSTALVAGGGCPGSRLVQFDRPSVRVEGDEGYNDEIRSELTHWPVQIRLLPPEAPMLRGARLLIAADCVPVAYPAFHRRLLRGRVVLIGCPKFDDVAAYVEKLGAIIKLNALEEIVVARMEVPCCMGIVLAVDEARRRAGVDVRVTEVVIGRNGEIVAERQRQMEETGCCNERAR